MYPLSAHRKRTIRSPINPMDKSTVISIHPEDILERKPTISPNRFLVPSGNYEHPGFLSVGPSSWWRDVDDESPLLEITTSSIQVAKSIVDDWACGLLGCDMSASIPGIFFVPGEIKTREQLMLAHPTILDRARDKQQNWYKELLRIGDVYWAKSGGSPLAINREMRMAAQELGAVRDWTKNVTVFEQVRCVACGAMRNPDYPVCGNCHAVVDKKRAEELDLVFAK